MSDFWRAMVPALLLVPMALGIWDTRGRRPAGRTIIYLMMVAALGLAIYGMKRAEIEERAGREKPKQMRLKDLWTP